MFEFIVMALEYAIEGLYFAMEGALHSEWAGLSSGFNSGQYSVYDGYISLGIDEFLYEAWSYWPGTDSSMYEDMIYSSYEIDVLERAFSDSIGMTAEIVDEFTGRAQELEETMWMFEAMAWF